MYDAMKRREIKHLRAAGLGVERIASHAGVSPRTVERVSAEDARHWIASVSGKTELRPLTDG